MKFLFVLFFAYLFYRLLVQPFFIEAPKDKPQHSSNRRQSSERTEGTVNIRHQENGKNRDFKGGEYVDYEEVD